MAPPDVRDWGHAMLNELPYVESAWAAVLWAAGSAIVLARYALVRRGQAIMPDGGLFARNVSLRKVALIASAVYVLAALLFFAAPPFRQGLRVSLAPWKAVLHAGGELGQSKVYAVGKRAEARHDADGLVFAAARVSNASEAARWADEAVRINPKLIWAYAVVALRHPEISEIHRWIPALERWQPANALFPLIAAESTGSRSAEGARNSGAAEGESAHSGGMAWQQAMAAAFKSSQFDDYRGRLEVLDRRVMGKYGFSGPEEVIAGEQGLLPPRCFVEARRYARSLLESGDRLERRGDGQSAEAKYWSVARFGQALACQACGNYERWAGTTLQWMAYQRLEEVAEKQGNAGEATLLAYLGKKFDPTTGDAAAALRKSVFGDYVAKRNAFVLQISALMMLIFAGLLASTAVLLIAGWRSRKRSRRSARGVMVFVTLTSAVGFLLSSATVYLTYRPYWYLLQGELLKSSTGESSGIRSFLAAIRRLPAVDRGILLNLPVYFWAAVILAAVAVLTLIFLRHLRSPPRLTEAQLNSRRQ
ncbi:MAG: hypothetical protein ACRD2B_08525 [Terriglobia bacterium]